MSEKQKYIIGWAVLEIVEAESLEDAETYARDGAMDDLKSPKNQVYLNNIENIDTGAGIEWNTDGKAHHYKEESE